MMKVYQPLCPDITFRLAADLSPDALEESEESVASSSSSSSEEEEPKLRLYEETQATSHNSHHHHHNNRFTSTAAVPFKSAKEEIYNQGHVSHVTSSSSGVATSTSESSSTSSPSFSESSSALSGNSRWCARDTEGVEKCHSELNSSHARDCAATVAEPATSEGTIRSQHLQLADDTATVAHGTKQSADDRQIALSSNTPPGCVYKEQPHKPSSSHTDDQGDDGVGSDYNDSVEDVSISHNVPMHPSPPPLSPTRSPALSRRGVRAAEESGGASGSSSDSEGSALAKSSTLRLELQKRTVKYQGPYTLACDITPSPMQDDVTMANTLSAVSTSPNGQASAAVVPTANKNNSNIITNNNINSNNNNNLKVPRRPRKLPEIPRKHQGLATASSTPIKSIFDEIQEALIKEVNDKVLDETPSSASEAEAAQQYPFIHKHVGHLFDKKRLLIGYATGSPRPDRSRNVSTCSVASEAGAAASMEEEVFIAQAQARPSGGMSCAATCSQKRRRKNSDGDGSRRHSSSTMSTPYSDLEVTHRGMHRFIPRHADEVQVGIGDPIHVIKEFDDLWCEGVNLRSGERGIFPAMYANDLKFLEDSDGEEEHWRFTMRFLGAVEVTSSSGDFALCQAINKVAQQGRIKTASLCTLEINQYGIRMIDKSKEGHESHKFTNFFALKNISFCGTHPNNNRYFAFITKHPRELRFACHVFHSDRSTHRARDALGDAFKRFYQEYMAFTHPTEDIWIE